MRRQLTINSKNLIVAFAACFGVLVIINYLNIYYGGRVNPDLIISLSFVMMFIGGYIFTSMGFNELHSPHKAYQYLTLPATNIEKLASVWFLTTILYVAVSIILLAALVIVCNLFALIMGSQTISFGFLLNFPIWNIIKVFFITQSIFLLGSIYFRKNNFLKTILALIVVGFILMIYVAINGYLFVGPDFHGIDNSEMSGSMSVFMEDTFPVIMKYLFNIITAPFFYVVTYFVLKERQV